MAFPYADRAEGGRALGLRLLHLKDEQPIVLGLPRGGVPVAYEVARMLEAPLDVFVVRKLGLPGHPELAMGAIASGGARVLNRDVLHAAGVTQEEVERVARAEEAELRRRERLYRGDRPPPDLAGRTVVLVDDGLATGASMMAAVAAAREGRPARVVAAAPVGARETCEMMRSRVDEVVCAQTPRPFRAVGVWYRDFRPTSDDEVRALLERAREPAGADAD